MITANARGRPISPSALHRIKAKRPPLSGKRWHGIPFGKLIDCLQHELEEQGWEFYKPPQAFVSLNRLDMAAEIEVIHDKFPVPIQDSCWTFGIRHGNGLRQATRVYCGLTYADDVGFVGMEWASDKNFALITDPEKDIYKIVDWFGGMVENVVSGQITAWQKYSMDCQTASKLLVRAGEFGILFPSGIYHAIQAYEKIPELDRTAWELCRVFGKQCKRSPPLKQMSHLSSFRLLVEEELYKGKT